MGPGALEPYERSLARGTRLRLVTDTGHTRSLDVRRWLGPTDCADETVLTRCFGPVLDVGCGPGRFVHALAARGVAALGVDIAATAVSLTRGQGLAALRRSVFADVPGEGRWPTALLVDGNIGIGGDPTRLLTRLRAITAPRGRVLVETAPDHTADAVYEARFSEGTQPVGVPFRWAEIGKVALRRHATRAGLREVETWTAAGRSFSCLVAAA